MKQQVLEEKRKVMVNVPMELEDKGEGVSTDEREEINQDIDPDFTIKKVTQHRTDITLFAAEVVRNGVSARAGAALYNAALKSHGLISDTDTKLVCDKNKLRRAMDLYAAQQKYLKDENILSSGGIQCIGSDGKRDKKTRSCEIQMINGEPKEKFTVESREHISYTKEPSGEYLCHSEVKVGTGRDLATDFGGVLVETNSTNSLLAILTDGTAVNTGWKDGMISLVERDLQRNLLLLICLLHEN